MGAGTPELNSTIFGAGPLTIVYGLLPQEGETIKGDDLKG